MCTPHSPPAERLKPNLEVPWDQPDSCFVVKPFVGFVSQGFLYSGFDIQVAGEPRDIHNNRFGLKAVEAKPTNEFTLRRPLMDSCYWRDKKAFEEDEHEAIKNGNGAAVTAYQDILEDERYRSFTLVFPEHMKLTDKPFVEETEWDPDELEVELEAKATKVKTGTVEVVPKEDNEDMADGEKPKTRPVQNLCTIMCWRLVDTASAKKIAVVKKKKDRGAAALAAKMLKGASQDDDDDADY
jgi:hypothetical protein